MSADTIGTPPAEVAAVFARYPQRVQTRLHWMRALILDVAAKTPGVGPLQETLRWGEPAYVTAQTKSGSTLRMDWKPSAPDGCAFYFICHTRLVETFRTPHADRLTFEGARHPDPC
jgi:hypothetical protein